jgi:hypothetical protein
LIGWFECNHIKCGWGVVFFTDDNTIGLFCAAQGCGSLALVLVLYSFQPKVTKPKRIQSRLKLLYLVLQDSYLID